MAFTQTQLDAIEAAIASGVLTVQLDGKSVTYQSMSDLIKARNVIKSVVSPTSTTCSTYASFTKD